MPDSSFSPPGLLQSVRELADGLVASVHDRLALLAVELQEEKFRLIRSFLWLAAIFFSALLAVGFLSLTIVYCCQGPARLVALISMTVVYVAALVALVLGARHHFAHESRPFAATLQEMSRDRACIRPEN
jgi:uncharacterized membrane protein YqjE